MHERGYTFNGSAPMAGLTQLELNTLRLGHAIRQEKAEQRAENEKRGRKHTEPRRSTREALREFENREVKAN